MRSRIAILVLAGALGLGAAQAAPHAAAAPAGHCKSGYVGAKLTWGHKCLKAGQFCKVGNREYLKYGFVCPATGHLRRR